MLTSALPFPTPLSAFVSVGLTPHPYQSDVFSERSLEKMEHDKHGFVAKIRVRGISLRKTCKKCAQNIFVDSSRESFPQASPTSESPTSQ